MTAPTGIDRTARVIACHEIDIGAPLATVWRLQADVNGWPAWQTGITAARRDGPSEPGNSFTWTSSSVPAGRPRRELRTAGGVAHMRRYRPGGPDSTGGADRPAGRRPACGRHKHANYVMPFHPGGTEAGIAVIRARCNTDRTCQITRKTSSEQPRIRRVPSPRAGMPVWS
jgi:hypothetical protein